MAEAGGVPRPDRGLVAILRGVRPDEVEAIAETIVSAGIHIIEVPLNSPEPFDSIARLADTLQGRALVGAGTVTTPDAARRVVDAGGELVVMPHADVAVIGAAVEAGALCVPGVATPTEAFAALGAGATALKLFPAELLAPPVVKAWRAVLPPGTGLLPVGGITVDNMGPWVAAGATGFGIGSALYKPGLDAVAVGQRASAFADAWAALEA